MLRLQVNLTGIPDSPMNFDSMTRFSDHGDVFQLPRLRQVTDLIVQVVCNQGTNLIMNTQTDLLATVQ